MRVTLSDKLLTVDIEPHIGGAISRLQWRGVDVMRKTPESALGSANTPPNVRQLCSYPLVPYSNRIGNAELIVRDKTFSLQPNFPGEPHAIHGVGWQRAWSVKSSTSISAQLRYQHQPDASWPFAFEAEQTFTLTENEVSVALRVTNLDEKPMPAGLGFHPFFPIDANTTLQAEWRRMWEMGTDKLPTTLVATPSHADFTKPRNVFDWKVDNCFVGWTRKAILRYPTHVTTLTASNACSNIVCFAPRDGRNFLALEPVSNINNAFALAAKGVPDTGTRMLGRGDSFDIRMSIAVSQV